MEKMSRIALFLWILVTLMFIVHPVIQVYNCTEPQLSFMERGLIEVGLIRPRVMCPDYSVAVMAMLKHFGLFVLGCILGYLFLKEPKKPEVYAWHGWVPPAEDQAMLDEALREGFSTRSTRRRLF